MRCLILLWRDNVRMSKFTQVQYNDLILTVVPDEGDEYYVLIVELKQGWRWEEMFALSGWRAFKKSV